MTRAQGKHREFSLNQSVATLQILSQSGGKLAMTTDFVCKREVSAQWILLFQKQ